MIEQSGARLVDVGTTNRTRLADYAQAIVRPGNDTAVVLKVHPSNYRVDGFVESTSVSELATLGLPVVVDIGSGLIDADVPWLSGPPPAWLAGEPAAVQTLDDGAELVTFSGDKLLGGPQAGIIAGRADLVAACAAHPLARALRCGGHVLASLQDVALAYLRRARRSRSRSGGWSTQPVTALRERAVRDRHRGECRRGDRDRVGPGRRLGARRHDPVVRCRARRRSPRRAPRAPTPIVARVREGRTYLDLRSVDPEDDAELVDARGSLTESRSMRVVATAGSRRPRQVDARAGTDRHRPDRFEEEKRRG